MSQTQILSFLQDSLKRLEESQETRVAELEERLLALEREVKHQGEPQGSQNPLEIITSSEQLIYFPDPTVAWASLKLEDRDMHEKPNLAQDKNDDPQLNKIIQNLFFSAKPYTVSVIYQAMPYAALTIRPKWAVEAGIKSYYKIDPHTREFSSKRLKLLVRQIVRGEKNLLAPYMEKDLPLIVRFQNLPDL